MNHERPGRAGILFVLIVALFWTGMLVGVSFIATPVKFLAPSLSLPVALDVGRQTFGAFSKIEILCALVLALLVIWGAPSRVRCVIVALLGAIVATEAAWLLPALDARVSVIIAGATPPPSQLHTLYVALEAAKLALLAVLVVIAARAVIRPPARP